MSIYQRSVAGTLRNRLREVARTFSGEPPTPEETRLGLELVLKARKELAGGQADLLRMLGPTAAADALGDAERAAAYAESLAVEAMINDAAGQTDRAEAMRRQAVAIAREAHRSGCRGRTTDRTGRSFRSGRRLAVKGGTCKTCIAASGIRTGAETPLAAKCCRRGVDYPCCAGVARPSARFDAYALERASADRQ
jgi:hypothetical protein